MGSKWVYLNINLHTDITILCKYMPPGIQLELEFQRNSSKFCLLYDILAYNYVIEVDDLSLKVDRIVLSKNVVEFYK